MFIILIIVSAAVFLHSNKIFGYGYSWIFKTEIWVCVYACDYVEIAEQICFYRDFDAMILYAAVFRMPETSSNKNWFLHNGGVFSAKGINGDGLSLFILTRSN